MQIKTAQVTIDGPEEIHNRTRFLKNGEGTYRRIINNLLQANENLEVVIRVNIQKENIKYVPEFVDSLKQVGIDKRNNIKPYFSLVRDYEIDKGYIYSSCFSVPEFSEEESKLRQILLKKGFQPANSNIQPKLYGCGAVSPNSILVEPDGTLYLLLYFYNDKKLCSATFEYKERQNMFFACMNRQLSRPRLVKIKSLFETLDQELKNEYPSFFNALYRYYKCNYVFSSMIEVLGKGYNIFLFIYCAVGIYNKSITIGEFVIIKNYYTMLLQASTQIIAILKTYPNMLVPKKRLNEILNIPSENNGNTLLKKIDSVKLEDFSFSYNSKKIFEHFNYEFHKGNIYLIKGKNGVGKTTLINNILGLYIESYGGDILYNNYSIKELNLYEMRKNLISITEQEPVLFYQGNILKNIENNSNAAAMRLIKNFGLKDIGVEQCSGGEKQKISIINSLLKNGELLILDEPSSALDKNSTIYLQKELVKLKSQKIIIIISHDLQMDKIADKILDLDDKNNEEII